MKDRNHEPAPRRDPTAAGGRSLHVRPAVRVAGAVLAIGLALGLAELGLRLLGLPHERPAHTRYIGWSDAIQLSPHPFFPGATGPGTANYFYRYRPNATWATRYADDPQGRFEPEHQVTYRMNSIGLREREIGAKAADARRALVLGDSIAFGEGVRRAETFAKVAEDRLRATESRWEVINAGINGYGIRDELVLLRQLLPTLEPDVVVWQLGPNDISHVEFERLGWRVQEISESLAPLTRARSALIRWLGSALEAREVARARRDFYELYRAEPWWSELGSLLAAGRDEVRAAGGTVLVLWFPELSDLSQGDDPHRWIRQRLRERLASLGMDWADLSETFARHGETTLTVHPADAHPNAVAHALAGRLLADRLSALHAATALEADEARRPARTDGRGDGAAG